MIPGANRQIDGTLHEMLNPFVKIDQLASHPMLVLQFKQITANSHQIIFCSDVPQPLKPGNMKMKIGGQKKFHCYFEGLRQVVARSNDFGPIQRPVGLQWSSERPICGLRENKFDVQ